VLVAGQISGLPVAEVLAGAAAILGHNYSFALRFRGGPVWAHRWEGCALSIGRLGGLDHPAVLVIASPATLGRLVDCPNVDALRPTNPKLSRHLGLDLYPVRRLGWIIIVNAHRPNIQRLRQGTERRLSFTKTSPTPSA